MNDSVFILYIYIYIYLMFDNTPPSQYAEYGLYSIISICIQRGSTADDIGIVCSYRMVMIDVIIVVLNKLFISLPLIC